MAEVPHAPSLVVVSHICSVFEIFGIKETIWQMHKTNCFVTNIQCPKFQVCLFPRLGVILRDSHGVAQVRFVTGNKILRILKSKGLAPDLPEDLYHLIKKAVAVRKHLERNRKV